MKAFPVTQADHTELVDVPVQHAESSHRLCHGLDTVISYFTIQNISEVVVEMNIGSLELSQLFLSASLNRTWTHMDINVQNVSVELFTACMGLVVTFLVLLVVVGMGDMSQKQ